MKAKSSEMGVGMMEVLVALIVLAIGALGYVMLQVRALEATAESSQRLQAVNIARDLAERIRVNRDAWTFTASPKSYFTELSTEDNQKDRGSDCASVYCNASALADYDVNEIYNYAAQYGMKLGMDVCDGNSNGRYCLYVAWGDTTPKNSSSEAAACMNGSSYRNSSTCVMMEVY